MRRFSWFLIVVALALLWGGGQGVYTAVSNPDPLQMSCAEYVAKKPGAEWVHLSECGLRMVESMYAGPADDPSEVFIPILPRGADASVKPLIILASKNKQLLKLVATGSYAESLHDWEGQGLVQFGIELDDSEKEQISQLTDHLQEDFVIIEHEAEPALGTNAVMLALGLGLSIWLILGFVRRKPSEASPSGEDKSQLNVFVGKPGQGISMEQAREIQQEAQQVLTAEGPSVKINAAARLMTAGQFADAISTYREIAERHPEEQATCESQIGAAYFFLGDHNKAIQYYHAARDHGADASMMEDNIQEAQAARQTNA